MNKSQIRGSVQATIGMLLVGSLVAVNASINDYPIYTAQAIRYALAALALYAVLAIRPPPPIRLNARDIGLLIALATTGLAIFNIGIAEATRHASPALVGIIVGSGPIVMALVAPLVARTGRPSGRIALAAVVVTAGTAVACGLGGGSLWGVTLAVIALGGEVSFSLLAMPLLPKLGALRVSAYSAAVSVPLLLVAGLAIDGTAMAQLPTRDELLGIVYLGLIVTAAGFLLWYDALPRLGADRAGLFTGIMPIGAVITMMLLGLGTPSAAELAGAALVIGGLVFGMRTPSRAVGPPRMVESGDGQRSAGTTTTTPR